MMGDSHHLLALETSGKSGSVALATSRMDGSLGMDQEVLDPAWGSARTLAPAIARLLDRQRLSPRDVHAIAVVQGPGSFTGLRVGAATAKTMAWALGIPLIAVDALDCVAHQVSASFSAAREVSLVIVSDAYRGQVFRAVYHGGVSGLSIVEKTGVEDIGSLADRFLGVLGEDLNFAGPGVDRMVLWMEEHRSDSAHLLAKLLHKSDSVPMAVTVAELGWRRWERGEFEDVLGFLPKYYRGSAAEEKRNRSGQG